MTIEADVRARVLDELREQVYPAVMGDRPIAPDEDFFAAGGDSIELMRLLVVAQEHFDVDVEVREFFGHPTLSRLAELIGAELREPVGGAA